MLKDLKPKYSVNPTACWCTKTYSSVLKRCVRKHKARRTSLLLLLFCDNFADKGREGQFWGTPLHWKRLAASEWGTQIAFTSWLLSEGSARAQRLCLSLALNYWREWNALNMSRVQSSGFGRHRGYQFATWIGQITLEPDSDMVVCT